MADMVKIRARQNEPDLLDRAAGVAAAIERRIDKRAQLKLAGRAKAAHSRQAKVILMRQLADDLGKAAAGLVPCKKGCNQCCYMATQLTVEEAELIARETGAKLTMPKRFNDVEAIRAKYTGVACTFLTPKGCSIYAQRPYSCRVVFSIDRDETLCAIVPGEIINTPSLNYRAYNDVFVEVFDGRLLYADIREFFVPRTGKKE